MKEITFGRSTMNDVVLRCDDQAVSRFHMKIVQTDDGVVKVVDTSKNGVYVNNRKVSGEMVLKHGDLLRIGAQTMIEWEKYLPPFEQKNPLALAGFICSFFGPAAIVGLVFCAIGLNRAPKAGGKFKGFAIAGLVLSIIQILFYVAVFIVALVA